MLPKRVNGVNGETVFIERQRNTGQSGVEQWSVFCPSVLLHPSQHDFSDFSMIAAETVVDKPVNIKTAAIKSAQELPLRSDNLIRKDNKNFQ